MGLIAAVNRKAYPEARIRPWASRKEPSRRGPAGGLSPALIFIELNHEIELNHKIRHRVATARSPTRALTSWRPFAPATIEVFVNLRAGPRQCPSKFFTFQPDPRQHPARPLVSRLAICAFAHQRSDLGHWRGRLGAKLELLLAESLRIAASGRVAHQEADAGHGRHHRAAQGDQLSDRRQAVACRHQGAQSAVQKRGCGNHTRRHDGAACLLAKPCIALMRSWLKCDLITARRMELYQDVNPPATNQAKPRRFAVARRVLLEWLRRCASS